MDKEKIVSEIDEALRIGSVSSRFEFVFFDKKHAVKLPYETRALVKHKDGFLEMAVWCGKKYGWYINGKRHREDGPAFERANGDKAWYINGEKLTEEEFDNRKKPCIGKKVVIDGIEYTLK
jgi:hypothetical protein